MILTGNTIRQLCIFTPFSERTRHKGLTYGVGPAGYDVRIDQEVRLMPGGFSLASTVEHFNMPQNVLGIVHDKSTWARVGLAAQNTVIEPGWRGYLTLELTNHGDEAILIEEGMAIAQIIIHQLDDHASVAYDGKYQDQQRGPQPAIFEK
ncbi:dCTP deaminase [Nitratireductor sp. OM-1]|uniref:dCTP deaminase n=1 Tax=Nitratireductor sp. OM-1 TaxID=1756988 RepID=UPI000DE06473|nr:dCTP deaminase [Nitratireductor sp. OM-1]